MKFDQCLFGYDDGHRLLASSLPLGTETSLLTELSDLAPGTIFNQSEGYWTGLPVPGIGRYVLMRTWPAPEMPRPGCVWTHALLIEPTVFESIEDLSALQAFAIRPNRILDKERYREPFYMDVNALTQSPKLVDSSIVKRLLLSLYAGDSASVEINSPGQLDAPLFAVWSQQWPRLRRNLRFQTAASRAPRSTGSARFDVTAELVKASTATSRHVEEAPWLAAAALDVQEGASGTLRSFLWRYGRDVRRQRGSFLPLIEIKAIDTEGMRDSEDHLVEIVTTSFPNLDDAQQLKHDLIDGNLAAEVHPQLIRRLLLSETKSFAFPMPSDTGISKLIDLWPKRREDMLSLLEIAIDAVEPVGKSVFDSLTGGPQESLIWLLTHASSPVRKRIIQKKPELLLADWVLDLESPAVAELLPMIPEELAGTDALLAKLLVRNDRMLTDVAFEYFPVLATGQIILAAGGASTQVADVWWQKLKQNPTLLLQPEVFRHVSRTSQIYTMAELLGWVTPDVIATGSAVWLALLDNVSNDLSAEKMNMVNCFLIAIAASSEDSSGTRVVEKLFDVIHDQLLASRLSEPAREILKGLLPDIGWIRAWDVALRFRIAIANAYVRYRWPPQSYANLAATRKVRRMLANAAAEVSGGSPYAEAADV